MMKPWPADPIKAVTHPDPFPYYRALADRPAHFDERIDMWVVARPNDVRALLAGPAACVRPIGTPMPQHLVTTAAGASFVKLVRFRDDDERDELKLAMATLFAALPTETVAVAGVEVSGQLQLAPPSSDAAIMELWMKAFPVGVLAALCGFEHEELHAIVEGAEALAIAFAPGASLGSVADADRAALRLAASASGLDSPGLIRQFRAVTAPHEYATTANAVGWFFQTFDACAGLIGSVVAALAERGDLPTRASIEAAVSHVANTEPPIHNTRRFLREAATIGGVEIPNDASVLVVLVAGAGFGHGKHRCPADRLAPTIATEAIVHLWPRLAQPHTLRAVGFRPSLNARVPRFLTSPATKESSS
jgi:cytochrome P450